MGKQVKRSGIRPTQDKCGLGGWPLLVSAALALSMGIMAATTEKVAAQQVCVLSPGPNGTAHANPGALACGPNSEAGNTNATAVGDGALAENLNSTALGHDALASGNAEGTTALGAGSRARNGFTTAVGVSAIAD